MLTGCTEILCAVGPVGLRNIQPSFPLRMTLEAETRLKVGLKILGVIVKRTDQLHDSPAC